VRFVFFTQAAWFQWLIAKEVSAMRTMLVLAGLLVLLPCSAAAQDTQDTPTAEFFGGYSYLRANPKGGFKGSNGSGWNASAAWNLNERWGIKGDFSGYYCCSGNGEKEHNFLFGPQFNIRREKANFFVHGLVGVSHGNAPGFSDTVLAWAGGGGVDIRLGERFAVRVAQVDYFGTHYANALQHHFRYSAGLVFRFGGK
jgi:hypothetical protein